MQDLSGARRQIASPQIAGSYVGKRRAGDRPAPSVYIFPFSVKLSAGLREILRDFFDFLSADLIVVCGGQVDPTIPFATAEKSESG
jgi:hypothetical protein